MLCVHALYPCRGCGLADVAIRREPERNFACLPAGRPASSVDAATAETRPRVARGTVQTAVRPFL